MAATTRSDVLAQVVIASLLAYASAVGAQVFSPGQAFTYDAKAVTADLRSDTLELSGAVRFVQGTTSIEAERATASPLRSDSPQWRFERSVAIRTENAELTADFASGQVVGGQIVRARVEGSPARFEQQGETPDSTVRGRAEVIEYDFKSGVVRLTNDVWFSYGKSEFRGDTVIYSLRDQRWQVNPGDSSGRVRGIIRPGSNKTSDAQPAPSTPALGESVPAALTLESES